jgi:hypothetical protein
MFATIRFIDSKLIEIQMIRTHSYTTMHKIIGIGTNYYKLTHQTTTNATNATNSLSQLGLNPLQVGFTYFKASVLLIIGFNHY